MNDDFGSVTESQVETGAPLAIGDLLSNDTDPDAITASSPQDGVTVTSVTGIAITDTDPDTGAGYYVLGADTATGTDVVRQHSGFRRYRAYHGPAPDP